MISFILVNYNTKKITYQTINSIIQYVNNQNYEIVLVDNASTDGSREFFEKLQKKILQFKYIYNKQNDGFGKANNIGFKHSTGNYIYILNSDTLLHTKDIGKIIKKKFTEYSNVGVITTKVQYKDGTPQMTVQNFTSPFGVFLRLLKIGYFVRNNLLVKKIFQLLPFKPRFLKTYFSNLEQERKEEYVDWACGCSLIFKREVYEKLNGFDERFFLYTEDEEICYRIYKNNYKILYTPEISITHLEGKSSNSAINEFVIKTKLESEIYFYNKHFKKDMLSLKIFYNIGFLLGYLFSKRIRIMAKYYYRLKK